MFGFRFIKTQPTDYVIQYRNGRARRAGQGLSFWYFAPTSSLVLVPTASINAPFIFGETTADFQDVTIQGQVTYRIAEPVRTAALLNYGLGRNGRYLSEDPEKLSPRLLSQVQVATGAAIKSLTLKQALGAGDGLVARVAEALRNASSVTALGLEILSLSVLAIKPKPETARALEAEAREDLLRRADEATYARRNAAVEQERAIRENELSTEVAVEIKKRQVREAQLEAERSVQERRLELGKAAMTGKVALEQQKAELVSLAAVNAREEADAQSYGAAALMRAFAGADGRVLQALASVNMEPGKIMALAFRDLADNAGKIGQLTITPDLLSELVRPALPAKA